MKLATVVTTAPRPRSTLHECLNSMLDAGFGSAIVVADGYRPNDVHHLHEGERIGALGNWMRALRVGLDQGRRWVLVAQDDTRWARNTCEVLEREIHETEFPKLGYLSLHTDPKVERELRARYRGQARGWLRSRLGWEAIGAQAYLFPVKVARKLLRHEPLLDFARVKDRNIDRVVSRSVLEMGYRTYYRIPCFVSHGFGSGNSSLREKRPRDTHCWTEVAA